MTIRTFLAVPPLPSSSVPARIVIVCALAVIASERINPVSLSIGSEPYLQPELKLPRRLGLLNRTETRIIEGLHRRIEVRMIEHIERFDAELHRKTFPDVEAAAHHDVEILERRPDQIIAALVAERARRGKLERVDVEPLLDGPGPGTAVADHVRPVHRAQHVGIVLADQGRKRAATLQRQNS